MIVYPPLRRTRPADDKRPTVFLAGSIEMGAADEWQRRASSSLDSVCSRIYNPRRPDWDSSWEQGIDAPEFNAQVNWELDMIFHADLILFCFDKNTKSAITLQEHGICSVLKPQACHVYCPDEFWRKGNVDILSERAGMASYSTFSTLIAGVDAAARGLAEVARKR